MKTNYKNRQKKFIKFRDTEIKEHKFHQHKVPILINDTHVNKIVVSNKVPFGKDFKYLIGYKDAQK